jgi:hypothetical protein
MKKDDPNDSGTLCGIYNPGNRSRPLISSREGHAMASFFGLRTPHSFET